MVGRSARRDVVAHVSEDATAGAARTWALLGAPRGLGLRLRSGDCGDLMSELELVIGSFLSAHDLARMSATSRGFRTFADAVCCARLRSVTGALGDVRALPMVAHFTERSASGLPRLLDVLLSTRAESYGSTLSCGEAHSCVVRRSGETILAFGEGEAGQLGGGRHGNAAVPADMQVQPSSHEDMNALRFVAVACGAAHTAALAADGRIFSCGANLAGQLGPGVPDDGCARLAPLRDAAPAPAQPAPASADAPAQAALPAQAAQPAQEALPTQQSPAPSGDRLASLRFTQVVAGRYFTAAITTTGRVAVLGTGMDVHLVRQCLLPRGDMAKGERAVMLAAGAQHLLILSDRNRLFAVGDGASGKLGLARNLAEDPREDAVLRERRLTAAARRPALVAASVETPPGPARAGRRASSAAHARALAQPQQAQPEQAQQEQQAAATIVHIAAGGNHSGYITGDGKLYMWGCGRNGELGLGSFARAVYAPTRVQLPDCSPFALNMSCGKAHTAVLTTCGSIVTFGCGAYSQDGKQTRFWATNAPHAICDGDLAQHKPNLALVVCGGRHTAVVDVSGDLFTFGDPLCCGRPLRLAALQGNHHVPRRVELGGPESWAVGMTPRFGSV